jgi:preprotein translocase subunit SecF
MTDEPEEPAAPAKWLPKIGPRVLIIPIALLVACVAYLALMLSTTGLALGIDLTGGTQITADSPAAVNLAELEKVLKDWDAEIRTARSVTGWSVLITLPADINPDDVISSLNAAGYAFDYSVQTIGPALGRAFFSQAQLALAIAFIAMAAVVFMLFRTLLPSSYTILVAAADIAEALAISQLLGIELTLATFAALLLLIGYSIDSNVLLTARVLLSSEGDIADRISGARKTGLTMAGTTITVLAILLFAAPAGIIRQIAAVLLIGLLFDILNTWLINAQLLRRYAERRQRLLA